MFLAFNRRIKQGVRMDEISETHSRRPYVFAHFNVAYFGICVPHAWIYCIIHRADMDFGGFPIAVPLYITLSLFMLAFLLVARASGTPRLGSKLDWPLAALQALATIPLVVAVPLDGPAMLYAAIACAIAGGIGIAWLYLQWAPFYAELDVRNAIACAASRVPGCPFGTPALPAPRHLTYSCTLRARARGTRLIRRTWRKATTA